MEDLETPIKEKDDATYGLENVDTKAILSALKDQDDVLVKQCLEALHAADLADLFALLTLEQKETLITIIGKDFPAELLTNIEHPEIKEELLSLMHSSVIANAIASLENDDAIAVLEDLDPEKREAIIALLPTSNRDTILEGLAYPDDSAGRLLEKQLVSVPNYWTVGSVIDFLRSNSELPQDFYQIFVVDPKFHPIGTVNVSRVLRANRTTEIQTIMDEEIHRVTPDMDQEEVAFIFRQYGLASAPVVNEDGRLVGTISVDDIVQVIEEEAEEDILRMGGVSESDIHIPSLKTTFHRFPWLFTSLLTAILVSMVVGLFQETIAQYVSLAVLMPIIAALTANAATQTATVAIRAIATKELSHLNAARVIGKEIAVGIITGGIFALLSIAMVIIRFGDHQLAIVFALAIILTMIIATFSGAITPLILSKLKIDPAIATGVFVTTITDMISFGSFLGLATWWLL